MSWETAEIAIVYAVVLALLWGFLREWARPDVLAMSAFALLLAVGVLGADEALAVFGSGAPITIGCMFVLSAALERTGLIDWLGRRLSRHAGDRPIPALVALLLAATAMSAFINNTPIVVILTPMVIGLCHSHGITPSRVLIPLSFGCILGGTTTLIGSSTNLVVDGVSRNHGLAPFGIFEITGAGLVLAAAGLAYLALFGYRLLPDRETLASAVPESARRRFLAELLVPVGSPFVGKTLRESGLTEDKGIRIIDVIRPNAGSIHRNLGKHVLAAGDRIVMRTHPADLMELHDLAKRLDEALQAVDSPPRPGTVVMEAIVGPNSRLAGRRVNDLFPRELYHTYVLAVHRRDQNLRDNFDQTQLAFGDTLLLEGPPGELRRMFDRGDLLSLTEPTERAYRRDKAPLALTAIAALLIFAALDVGPISALALIAAVAVVALGCVEASEAYKAIHWPILFLIFGTLGVGVAMDKTGAALLLAEAIADLAIGLGPTALLGGVYGITAALTAVISNNASAILLTPIAIGIASEAGLDPRGFVVAVMFAASASFATPIGYQTNTFIFGAGGYRFVDFVRIGVPLNLLLWAVTVAVVPLFWPL